MASIYKVDDDFDYALFEGSSCAFGVFDGVHRGHDYLLTSACDTAKTNGGTSIALTFDTDPDEMFRPHALVKLMSNQARIEQLAGSGVDAVVVLHFTREFSSASPMEFLHRTFGDTVPAFLHIGSDFRFGYKASGTVADLQEWAATTGAHIYAHTLEAEGGEPITATRIRALLAETRIEEANALLGRPYSVCGCVQQGRGDGQQFGFRTANLVIPRAFQALGEGVYGAYAHVDGRVYKAAVSVGVSPLFEESSSATCEVHILDFEGDIYGHEITVEFMHYLRPMIKFNSVEELIATVNGNIAWVRQNMPERNMLER